MTIYRVSDKSLEFVCPLRDSQCQQLCVMRSCELRHLSHAERRAFTWASNLRERSEDRIASHTERAPGIDAKDEALEALSSSGSKRLGTGKQPGCRPNSKELSPDGAA